MLGLEHLLILQDGFRLSADCALSERARIAVVGPSGGGKSTLLGAVAGFVALSRGRIMFNGADISALPPSARPVSILFQDNNLFPHLSVFDNVALGLGPSLRLNKASRARVTAVLERVGLSGFGARRPAQLSGGQQSRVALARVLLRDRPLLLLDEPFSALGPALRVEMLDLVAEICAETGATLLMVTHDLRDAHAICDDLLLVADGAVSGPMPTGSTLADPPQALRDYIGG